MRKIIEYLKFQLQMYFKGSSFVMPLIAAAVFLYMMYSIKPLNVVSSYLISSTVIFLLMMWVGLSVSSGENVVSEQLILLRMQSEGGYYTGKIIFLGCIVLLFDGLFTFFPVVQNLINSGGMFVRPLLVSDVVNAFFIQGGCAIAGAALGSLLHPRVMIDRKLAILLTVLLAVLSVARVSVTAWLPALKVILWVLPPVMLPAEVFGNSEYFQGGQTAWIFIELMIYGIVYCAVKSLLCHRNKF